MKVEEAAIMNHKISAKAVKSNEIQAVDERRRGEIASGCTSQQGRQDGLPGEERHPGLHGPNPSVGKTRSEHLGFNLAIACINFVIYDISPICLEF